MRGLLGPLIWQQSAPHLHCPVLVSARETVLGGTTSHNKTMASFEDRLRSKKSEHAEAKARLDLCWAEYRDSTTTKERQDLLIPLIDGLERRVGKLAERITELENQIDQTNKQIDQANKHALVECSWGPRDRFVQ